MPLRKVVKENLRKAIKWAMETEIPFTEPTKAKQKPKPLSIRIKGTHPGDYPDLKGPEKTRLVLATLLHIHDSVVDADTWEGYEGTPDQIDKLKWEVYGILAKNPEVTTAQEVYDIWLKGMGMGWVPEDLGEDEEELVDLTPQGYSDHQED